MHAPSLRLLGLLFWLAAALGGQQGEDPAGLVPALPGWQPKDKPLVYRAHNLYEYIDGAAESYLSYDFSALAVQNYLNAAGKTLTVEIYRHATARDAFGIYSSEKPLAGNFLPLGGEGYQEEGVLNFYAGCHYVKISAYELDSGEQAALPRVAEAVLAMMGPQGKGEPPAELALFPAAGKIANSERFILKNFLGHTFLRAAFRADYEKAGARFQLFLIRGRDPAEARGMLQKWLDLAAQKPAPDLAEGRIEFTDPYNGAVNAEWRGADIWGAIKCPAAVAVALLDELRKNLGGLKK